jgi:hypothetical protein
MASPYALRETPYTSIILNCICIAICCVSLYCIAVIYPEFHILYRTTALSGAVVVVLAFATICIFFAFARFSFGYFIGFYFYIMIAGYLWLNSFSDLSYNHALTGLSAAASAVAFLLPALFICSPVRQLYVLSPRAFDRLLNIILLIGIATIAAGAHYNFRIVSIENIYNFRDKLALPTTLDYLIGLTSNALLPFAFAGLVLRKHFWRAGFALLLMLLFYPITLAKLALFTPVWLVALTLVSKAITSKTTVVLSLLVPMSVGIVLFMLYRNNMLPYNPAITYFGLVNFRMIAIPSLALDYYNYFFSTHDLTYYCQMRVLKLLVSCPYQEQLAIVIYKFFGVGGYFNASLFATEGVASVGPLFSPFAAFACGLVIALGNRLSAGLPNRLILISGAVLTQAFLNVPFTTVMLSHGAGVMFLLWYLTPREIFDPASNQPQTTHEPLIFRWNISAKLAYAFAAIGLWLGASYWLKTSYVSDPNFAVGPNVAGQKILLLRPFTRYSALNFAVVTERPFLFDLSPDNESLSTLELYENSKRLRPADSPLGDAPLGRGRFLFEKKNGVTLTWSSSDNSDPNTNGRAYWVVKPASVNSGGGSN